MKKKILLKESQLKPLIRLRLIEYGQKGRWKPEWDKEDQMLAMYNALYGIEEFGINKQEVAEKIIGTSLASFNQQTANFDFQHTGQGLDRPHDLQTEVYEEFKDLPKEKFKEICRQIIDDRIENPPEAVTKKQIGGEIGSKRDQINQERMDALRKKGVSDPSRFKIISSVPAEPTKDVEVEEEKENIRQFISDLLDRLDSAETKDEISSLSTDVEFLKDYLDNEMVDDEEVEMVAEVRKLFLKKQIPELDRIKQVMNS